MTTALCPKYATSLRLVSATIVCFFAFLAPAHADDGLPPSWRGFPNTTFQKWTFDAVPGVPEEYFSGVPDVYSNQYGNPIATADAGAVVDGKLLLDAGIPMFLTIPNHPSVTTNDYTLVSFQMTYHQIEYYAYEGDRVFDWSEGRPAVYMHYERPSGENPIDALPGELVDEHDILLTTVGGSSWRLWQSVWRVEPSQVLLFRLCEPFGSPGYSTVRLDDVIVDTHYVPEPSSILALLCGIGGLAGSAAWKRQ